VQVFLLIGAASRLPRSQGGSTANMNEFDACRIINGYKPFRTLIIHLYLLAVAVMILEVISDLLECLPASGGEFPVRRVEFLVLQLGGRLQDDHGGCAPIVSTAGEFGRAHHHAVVLFGRLCEGELLQLLLRVEELLQFLFLLRGGARALDGGGHAIFRWGASTVMVQLRPG
jgi:hypothetical protein